MLTTGQDGLPVLALSNAKKVRALIGLRTDGSVYLTLSNSEGKLQWNGFINETGPHVDEIAPKWAVVDVPPSLLARADEVIE
jgi:hypothetical protein